MTVFINTGGSLSSRGRNEALNRFNPREVQVGFRAVSGLVQSKTRYAGTFST